MKFKVDQQSFLSELSLAMAAVENKQTVPVSSLIHFQITGSNMVLTTTNFDITIKSRVRVESDGDGEFVMPAARLHNWISKTQAGEMTCSAEKRFSARIHSSTLSLSLPSAGSFPKIERPSGPSVEIDADVIGPMFRRVAFVVPGFETQSFNFAAVLLQIDKERLQLSATDGHRMSVCTEPGDFLVYSQVRVLVSKKFASEVSRLANFSKGLKARIFPMENHIAVAFGDHLIYSRHIGGSFPNVERGFPAESKQIIVLADAAETSAAISRVALVADDRSRRIVLDGSAGTMAISSGSDVGDGTEIVESATMATPFAPLHVNASYVMDGLKAIDGIAEIRVIGPSSPIEIRQKDFPGFRHIICGMGASGPVVTKAA